jgi:opacity protein-like surface antigen
MGQTRSIIIGLALVLGQTAGANAADLGLPPPPLEMAVPCAGCVGPWYFKGFIGAANPNLGDINTELFQFNDFKVFHEDIKSSTLFGVGVGYEFNTWLRFDVTGEYRGKSLFIAQDSYPGGFDFDPGTNEYTADIESWLGLANAYLDLGTYFCVTPYIGGGVGFASISVLGLKDVNVPNNSVFYAADHTESNFAWAVYAGLAYDVTPSVTIDLAYRYTDLGDARSGTVTAYDNSSFYKSVELEDITSQDLMLGVRWKLGSQPAPMPVAFK